MVLVKQGLERALLKQGQEEEAHGRKKPVHEGISAFAPWTFT
jgi:hypothetical protein